MQLCNNYYLKFTFRNYKMYGPSQKLKVKMKFKNIMKVIHASTIIIARFN